jgi:XTP/dITP diphosphohydrolase
VSAEDGVRLVLATRNRHKVEELRDALGLSGVKLETLDDHPEVPEVVEDGATFEDNARKKAREVAEATGLPALADDSGLVVDALGGEPGVHSARYAGEASDDAANRAKLLREMSGEADRRAAFECVLVLAEPGGREEVVAGTCRGALLGEERGSGGFGYDPLFVPEPGPGADGRTFAEMSLAEKRELSHRGRALAAAREPFARFLGLR